MPHLLIRLRRADQIWRSRATDMDSLQVGAAEIACSEISVIVRDGYSLEASLWSHHRVRGDLDEVGPVAKLKNLQSRLMRHVKQSVCSDHSTGDVNIANSAYSSRSGRIAKIDHINASTRAMQQRAIAKQSDVDVRVIRTLQSSVGTEHARCRRFRNVEDPQ